jgi:hypothetical protein
LIKGEKERQREQLLVLAVALVLPACDARSVPKSPSRSAFFELLKEGYKNI